MTRVDAGADVSQQATLGEGTVVWGLAQVREGAALGPSASSGVGPTSAPGSGWVPA